MKLRILGDTLRLRLAQGEVAQLRELGHVEQSIHFGPEGTDAMSYAVISDRAAQRIQASFQSGRIVVRIPHEQANDWVDGSDVSLRASQPAREDETLEILIEKDFKCLVPRTGEEDSDGFPNPSS
ncbi:MAG: hypothetical protein JKY37_14030 [Nannocystaceae bacterium]|nr:hypothetical protein [Nannocystaceae bacterium]